MAQQGFQFGALDSDEIVLLFFSSAACLWGIYWLMCRNAVLKVGSARSTRAPFVIAVVAGMVALYLAASAWGAKEVRENGAYLLVVLAMGGAVVTLAGMLFPWLGIGLRDDAFERRNFAAAVGLSGAALGVILIYIGASMGEGPSLWENVFGTVLGLAAWLGLWLGLELSGHISRSVADERDVASGLRLAGYLVAQGLVLGRALAGDWHSVGAEVSDLARYGWPALALAALAVSLEALCRPSLADAIPSWKTRGLAPGILYVALAAAWVWCLGWWEGAPR